MLLAVGTLFPLRFSFLSLMYLEIESKSQDMYCKLFSGGRRQRTTCESQHRGKQETVSGVQIHQNTELFGFLEKSQVM